MFSINESDTMLSFRISSTMDLVDRVIGSMTGYVENFDQGYGMNGLTIVARELLVNAVEHGNKGDKQLEIGAVLERIGIGRYRLAITDQGEGLAPERLSEPLPLESTTLRSRGLALANVHADEIISDPTKKTVTAFVTLTRNSHFSSTAQNGVMTIAPQGDITATVADSFRTVLLAWYDSDNPELILEMSETRDMDSVCLSVLVSLCNMPGVAQGNRHIRLTNASVDLVNLMTLTRLTRLIEITSQGSSK